MGVPINNVTRRVVFAASGTGPYAFTFEILAATDIAVYRDDTLLTLTTDYSVTINANGTGSVTLVASPTGATQIAIVGNRTIQRTTDFVTGGDFFANTLNDELDQQTIFAQQNAEGLARALSAPQTDPTSINMTLPRAALRANKALGFDANGNPIIADTIGTNRGNWAASTLYYARDIVKDTTNNNIWQCIVQHTSSGSQPINTNADAAKWTLLVDAASASTSATNAANSASAAATSASNAASSASSASTSASNAASSASAASTSASNASTSATNAASSASAASTSATNASNSASSASTSATNAAASASAAAASYDSFDDQYLGAKSSDPTLDNDGNALLTGALYYNTANSEMRVYTGSTWQSTISTSQPSAITVNSSSDALRITQTGAGNALVVEDSANPDSSPFVVDASGNITIGSLTRDTTGAINGKTQLQGLTGTEASLGQYAWSASGGTAPFFTLNKSRGVAVGTRGVVADSDTLGAIYWSGDDGTNFIRSVQITAAVDGTPGTNDMPGRLVFSTTADGASSPTERMRINSAGNVGIGGTPFAGATFVINKNITGATTGYGVYQAPTVSSDVTGVTYGNYTFISTADAATGTSDIRHYFASQGTITGGSRVAPTNQYGFFVASTLTGATNNYGFYSNIASGTGRWNFYANGTAANYFAGSVGIGTTTLTGYSLRVGSNITGAVNAFGIQSNGAIQSDVTTGAFMFRTAPTTAAASFTLTSLVHYDAAQGALGASSAITNQYGFFSGSTLTGATNNFGFYSDIASGTGRWNFYANGTAENYLGGNLKIGGTAARATTAGTNQLVLFNGTAPVGTLANGVSFYSASGEARVMDAAGNSTLLSPHDSVSNEWIFHSKHTPTGKVLRIDVEKMLRFINDHFGLDMVHEFTEGE